MKKNTIAVIERDRDTYVETVRFLCEKTPDATFSYLNYAKDSFDVSDYDSLVFDELSYSEFLKDKASFSVFRHGRQYSEVIYVKGNPCIIFIVSQDKSTPSEELSATDRIADAFLRDLFLRLGIRHNLAGCKYLKDAILLTCKNSDYLNKGITKKLYPELAEKYGCSPSCIERAIRHTLTVCFDRGKFKTQAALFGNCFDNSHCPTNGEFIALAADMLEEKIRFSTCECR